jgi:hypothetical protein
VSLTIAPSEQDVFLALWTFLRQILPAGDAVFTGSIAGDQLTVTSVDSGTINLGDPVLGNDVAPGTVIAAFGTGTGGVGIYTVSPNQGAVAVASCVMATGVEVVQGQVNRVPEPKPFDYVVMWTLRMPRLSTNVDAYADCVFTGSLAAGVLTVAAPLTGVVARGRSLYGVGVAAGSRITGYLTGAGGVGTYSAAPVQTVAAVKMAAGAKSMTESVEAVIQLDVHGPNSADFASIIQTVFRSSTATEAFKALNPAIAPLFADDPRQMPFNSGGEQQYQDRYIIEVHLQVNQSVVVDQQFADQLKLNVTDVETPSTTWPNSTITVPEP